MPKLTNDTVKNAMPEPGKRLEIRDDVETGLIFRVTDKGVRSWSVRYRNAAGEQRRKNLGAFPAVGLAKAREEARKAKGAVASGNDVVAIEKATRAEERRKHLHKLSGLADAYFIAAAEGTHKGGPKAQPKRETTIAEERRIFDKLVKPKFGDSAVANITRIEIRDFVSKQAKAAKSNGRHCRNIIRQLMSFAVREGVIDHNPAHDIAVAMPSVSTTVMNDVDLKAFWQACQRPQEVEDLALSLLMGIALRMAAVTLQRGGKVVGMRWDEIDRAAKTWLIPADRMKGKKAHMVPLSTAAIALLDEAKAAVDGDGSDFVFPSPRSEDDQPLDRRAFSRAMKRLVEAVKIGAATPHDLRRTGATLLTSERIGFSRFIVSQVIAHAGDTGGAAVVTGKHYDHNDYLPEKRRALDAWALLLDEIVTGAKRPENVAQMARQA
ncbi:tyrosine-type recombinase/integrase [Mesorhizobium sp. PAMC28654]|uniref:tyrosine-type recombinase/integrase n=1 Tax=Mesorhizobium sp. PAMC28654 TaxID=2880934 RepID=UPI001D0A1333|nr:site-specific integrase [Mesorhizobium sp. PAMC28654]UDL87015.1 tyrosine-type recombinase/integrase [Mesorhizobium sp. PAMC28654]